MDLGQLETFLCIAQEKSFSRAAEKLCRTQPAISIAIKRLEEELGESLFDRSSKGGTLTDAGQLLHGYASRMLNLRQETFEAFRELRGLHRGKVTIGANESTSLYLLPELLLEYRKRFPEIKIQVYRSLSERIPGEVTERNLDFGFLSYDPVHPELRSIEVYRDHMVLVVPPGHALAGRRDVDIRELGRELFVAHNAATPTRARIMELFAEHETPLNIHMELGTLQTIVDFVAQGAGLAILPHLAVKEALDKRLLVQVPVKQLRVEKTLRMVFRKESSLSHAAKSFLALVRERAPSSGAA